jgi:antitoxin CptB
MQETSDKKKLEWQCRRGMLELDVILIPFLEQYYDEIDPMRRKAFAELLQQADPDIYTWIMGFGSCSEPGLESIIDLIRDRMAIA